MPAASANTVDTHSVIYRATVEVAAAGGAVLMGALIQGAKVALLEREKVARDFRERDEASQSIKTLMDCDTRLRAAYPKVLLQSFLNPEITQDAGALQSTEVSFDELELMDDVQVQSSVVLARMQQSSLLAAEASLAELNALICGSLGLQSIDPARNPLRPDIYIAALQEVIAQQNIPTLTQLDWLAAMSVTLAEELREMYGALSSKLKREGVVAVGYAVRQSPGSTGARRAMFELSGTPGTQVAPQQPGLQTRVTPATPAARHLRADETLLTLDKLRRLLAGELGTWVTSQAVDRFQDQFARQFESGLDARSQSHADFDATVPAALEALKEMQQVDEVVQRLKQRQLQGAAGMRVATADALVELREHLRNSAQGIAQALSLEVVTLMIDKIARDPRLLAPVQALIARLEPAFLRLSLVDARLFTDKQHPARVLLEEITHRSLAYRSVQAIGFEAFTTELEQIVSPLLQGPIDSAAPFQQVLNTLTKQWQRAASANARAREEAVEVLQHVEQRNVLAEKIARDISSHRDAASVPTLVIEFLCGPWAQVVAQARLSGGTGSGIADKYQALISALLWSTHPELTRKNISKLTRLVPLLLTTLREGLDTIRYPATRTAAFLEGLMGLHQLAFRANDPVGADKRAPTVEPPSVPSMAGVSAATVSLLEEDPWVAPEEARASNFVQLSGLEPDPPSVPIPPSTSQANESASAGVADTPTESVRFVAGDDLPLGSWVELLVDGQWVRTQLTWASPHGTLFLFTSAIGTSQSMTRRSRDRLVAAGNLRVIIGAPVVEGALNAVAQIALRNSVDISL